MRIGVTGSRHWTDEATINAALDAVAFAAISGRYERLTVIHGAADGADAIADRWVRAWHVDELHVTAERHPAKWAEGKQAGFDRNQAMVRAGADLWLAFLAPCIKPGCTKPKPHDSHGATDCAERAEAAGIPLQVFRPGQAVVTIGGPQVESEVP